MKGGSKTKTSGLLSIVLLATATFLVTTQFRLPSGSVMPKRVESKVVIAPPIQVILYAGDRFLAANLEAIRVAAIGPTEEAALASYRIRAHSLVARLNACHEDNYYLANAMLSWGGSVDQGNAILERATDCRFWDEFPPFFLGFNRYFFNRDIDGAVQAIETAAARSAKNKTTLQRVAIVMESKKLNDEKMAAVFLRKQRDQTTDQKLAEGLDRRLKRLEGLITLREAQKRYEKQFNRRLTNPQQLVATGILDNFPQDPMGLGYEFVSGEFQFKQLKFPGMENLQ